MRCWDGVVCPGCVDLGTMHLSPRGRAAHRTGVWQLAGGGAEEATSTRTLCCARPSRAPLSAIPRTVAHQVPLFMEFSRQEYWSGLPCPLPGDLSDPGIEPVSLMFAALAGGFFYHKRHLGSPLILASASAIWGMFTSDTRRKVFQGPESLGKPGSSQVEQ